MKPLKERTTKAERRAKQEADREAKRAARESGWKLYTLLTVGLCFLNF